MSADHRLLHDLVCFGRCFAALFMVSSCFIMFHHCTFFIAFDFSTRYRSSNSVHFFRPRGEVFQHQQPVGGPGRLEAWVPTERRGAPFARHEAHWRMDGDGGFLYREMPGIWWKIYVFVGIIYHIEHSPGVWQNYVMWCFHEKMQLFLCDSVAVAVTAGCNLRTSPRPFCSSSCQIFGQTPSHSIIMFESESIQSIASIYIHFRFHHLFIQCPLNFLCFVSRHMGDDAMRNAKTVDPRDKKSTAVLQLETAMGAAIQCFQGASSCVRSSPKTCQQE